MNKIESDDGTVYYKVESWEELEDVLADNKGADDGLNLVSSVTEMNTEDEGKFKEVVFAKTSLTNGTPYQMLQSKLVQENPFTGDII